MAFQPHDLSELDDLTEEHLGFSALSEGLGFAKKPNQAERDFDLNEELQQKSLAGTGAVAAGPVRFASQAQIANSAPTLTTSTLRTTRAEPSAATSILQKPAASQAIRLAAFAIDASIVLLPLLACWALSFGSQAWEVFRADKASPLFLYSIILGGYFLLSESFGGQSLGKMLLHLHVVEDDKYQKPVGLKESAFRLFMLVIGTAFAGIGLLASFRDNKRRPWQDRFTGSIVRPKP
ncbi:MAG: RDD family protein [Bacteriovoracia bacterium]